MKLSKLFAIGVIGLGLSPTDALGQREDQFAWGLGGGATIPSSLANDLHKTSAHGVVSLGIGMVDSPWGIRFDGFYSGLGKKNRQVNAPGGNATVTQGSARIFSLFGNGVLKVYGSNTHLYTLAGMGGYWYNPDGTGTSSENDFGIQAGAGIWLNFANAFIEAKWVNLYRALPHPETGENGKRSMRLYPITLGILY